MVIAGYEIDSSTARCITSNRIIARAKRGRAWLSFENNLSRDGFHVTNHGSRAAAERAGSIYPF